MFSWLQPLCIWKCSIPWSFRGSYHPGTPFYSLSCLKSRSSLIHFLPVNSYTTTLILLFWGLTPSPLHFWEWPYWPFWSYIWLIGFIRRCRSASWTGCSTGISMMLVIFCYFLCWSLASGSKMPKLGILSSAVYSAWELSLSSGSFFTKSSALRTN